MSKNIYKLYVDIKRHMTNKTVRFVQFDSAELHFYIFDNGKPIDLTKFTSAKITNKLPSGILIYKDASIETENKIVRYLYSEVEMVEAGIVDTLLSLYNENGEKISINPFKVEMVKELN